MKTLIRTKLLDENHIELRSYELNKTDLRIILCGSKDYKNCFHVGEPYQIYTLKQQEKGKVINTQTSQFYPFSTYHMVKFLWKPTKKIETEQLVDKEIQWDNKIGTARVGY